MRRRKEMHFRFVSMRCNQIKFSESKDDDQMSQEVKICTTKRSGIEY